MIAMNISGAAAPTGKTAAPAAADSAADPGDPGFAAAMDSDAQPATPPRTWPHPQLARAMASAAQPETPLLDGELPKDVPGTLDDPGTLSDVMPDGAAPDGAVHCAQSCLARIAPVRPAPEIAVKPQTTSPASLDAWPTQPAENDPVVTTNGALKAQTDKTEPENHLPGKADVNRGHHAAPSPLVQSANPMFEALFPAPANDGDVNSSGQADQKPVAGPDTPTRLTHPVIEPQPHHLDPVQIFTSAMIVTQLTGQTVPTPVNGPYPASEVREPAASAITTGAATVPVFPVNGEAATTPNKVATSSAAATTTPNTAAVSPSRPAAPVAIGAGEPATERNTPRDVPRSPVPVSPVRHQDTTAPDKPSRQTTALMPVDAPGARTDARNPDNGAPAVAVAGADTNAPQPTVINRPVQTQSGTGFASETPDAAAANDRPVIRLQPDPDLAPTSRTQAARQVPGSAHPAEKSEAPVENRQPNWPMAKQNRSPASPLPDEYRLSWHPGTKRQPQLAASPWLGVRPGGEPTAAETGPKIAALTDPLTAAPHRTGAIAGSKTMAADFPTPVPDARSNAPAPTAMMPIRSAVQPDAILPIQPVKLPAAPVQLQTVSTPLAVVAPPGELRQIHPPAIAPDLRPTALVGAAMKVASPPGSGIEPDKTAGNPAPTARQQPTKPNVPAFQTASHNDKAPGSWHAGNPQAPREPALAPAPRHVPPEKATVTKPTGGIAASERSPDEPFVANATRKGSQLKPDLANPSVAQPRAAPVPAQPGTPTPTLAPQFGAAVARNLPPPQDLRDNRDPNATRHPRELRGPQIRPALDDRPNPTVDAPVAVQPAASGAANSPALADPARHPETPPQARNFSESRAHPVLPAHRGPGPESRPTPPPSGLPGSESRITFATRPLPDAGPQQPPQAPSLAMPSHALPTDAPQTPESRPTPRARPEQPAPSRPHPQTAEVSADPPFPVARLPDPTQTDPRALQVNPPREDTLPIATDPVVQNVVPPVAMPMRVPGTEAHTSDTQPAPAFDPSPQQTHDLPRHLPAALAKAASGVDKDDRVELLLDPVELGKVRFELSSSADRVQVNVSVERPETLDLLRRNIETLRAEFRDAGFDAATLSFSQWGKGGDPAPQPPFARPTLFTGTPPEDAAPLTPQPARNTSRHGLDLRL